MCMWEIYMVYDFIRNIRDNYPSLVKLINNWWIYPYRKVRSYYLLKKNPSQIYTFLFEKEKVSFFLPYRKDLIEQTIIAKGSFFEISELKKVRPFVPKNAVYVDIGANVGNHLVFFGLFSDLKKIYAFEPNPDLFPILSKNVDLNELSPITTLYQNAIGSRQSKGVLVGSTNPDDTFYTDKSVQVTDDGNVQILPLDDIIKEKVDFIKIDVEGMEIEVLKGSLNRISADKPIIFIESDKISEVLKILGPYGYYIEKPLANLNYILKSNKNN